MIEQVKLSIADAKVLAKSLEKTLLVAATARSVNYGLFFQIITLRDNSDLALKEFREPLA